MLIDAESREYFSGPTKTKSLRYVIPSVAGSGSAGHELLIDRHEGKILLIRCVCDSTDYGISIRTKDAIALPSIEEILSIDEINKHLDINSLSILFSNNDTVEKRSLYINIENTDSVATGEIHLELVIKFFETEEVL